MLQWKPQVYALLALVALLAVAFLGAFTDFAQQFGW
jgi:hypothetical protein